MSVSLSDMAARYETIPDALALTLEWGRILPERLRAIEQLPGIRAWDVVGVGASEGPASLLTSVLAELGYAARKLPISHMLEPQLEASASFRGLILFSQGMSPNARIALAQAANYRTSVLFTATTDARPDRHQLVEEFPGLVCLHAPASEPGSLVRLVGPICASLSGLQFALAYHELKGGASPRWASALGSVPEAVREITRHPGIPLGNSLAACLAVGADVDLAPSLAWKWQEAVYERLPFSSDVLAFAHGPLQSIYDEEATLFSLAREGNAAHADLWNRLQKALHPARHRVVPLTAKLPGPLALFEFDARCNSILLAEMCHRGIDPGHWPGQSTDGPLYQIDGSRLADETVPPPA
jgi:hypothetical protein